MKPKVSVVVPCYKVEKYLDRCVESLVNQTLRDIEIILVDDGSPDRVPQMCDEWAAKDSRIKVLHKKNAGLGMACNSGIEVAVGEFIAFVDSDDWVDINYFKYMYDTVLRLDVDVVYSGIKRVDQHGNVSLMSVAKKETVFRGEDVAYFQLGMIATAPDVYIERDRPMSAKIVLYRRLVIDNNNIRFHSERQYLSEDLLFNLDFLGHCRTVAEVPEVFYYYFVNTVSLTQTLRKDRMARYKEFREYMLCRYDFSAMQTVFVERVNKMFIGYVRTAIEQIVRSSESFGEKKRLISEISADSIWIKLAKEYPVKKMPGTKRLIFQMTRYGFVTLLVALFKLKQRLLFIR